MRACALAAARIRRSRFGRALSAVAGSEEAALEILLEALRQGLRLSVYYCSCGTQGWIAEKAMGRGKKN